MNLGEQLINERKSVFRLRGEGQRKEGRKKRMEEKEEGGKEEDDMNDIGGPQKRSHEQEGRKEGRLKRRLKAGTAEEEEGGE